MALTRKMLKAMGIADEAVEQIIEAHGETVSALKDEAEKYKADAGKLPALQKQLDDAAKDSSKDAYKVKYETLKAEYDGYKTDVTAKESRAAKETAYKALLTDLKISPKVLDKVVKLADLDTLELADGKIKDAEKLTEALKTEWADFITTEGTNGAPVDTPPNSGGAVDTSKMTDAEYFAYQRDQQKGSK